MSPEKVTVALAPPIVTTGVVVVAARLGELGAGGSGGRVIRYVAETGAVDREEVALRRWCEPSLLARCRRVGRRLR